MQRANPTMITPVRYAGWSARNSQARANMKAGPITHERKSDIPKKRRSSTPSELDLPRSSYRTFVRTGYIISKRPIAIGKLTVPTRSVSRASSTPETRDPRASPPAIASAIHRGRNRSSVESRATTAGSLDAVNDRAPR